MAEQVSVSITDAVCQSTCAVLAQAPAQAMAQLYQSMAFTVAQMTANAVQAQQQTYIQFQAATAASVRQLLGTR